jgi:hypothetical protein
MILNKSITQPDLLAWQINPLRIYLRRIYLRRIYLRLIYPRLIYPRLIYQACNHHAAALRRLNQAA